VLRNTVLRYATTGEKYFSALRIDVIKKKQKAICGHAALPKDGRLGPATPTARKHVSLFDTGSS